MTYILSDFDDELCTLCIGIIKGVRIAHVNSLKVCMLELQKLSAMLNIGLEYYY